MTNPSKPTASKSLSLPLKIVGLLLALATPAAAQDNPAADYPSKPIRLIIPFPPGGSNDVVGRMIALKLSDRLGKQVVVDNRGGAGGTIGTEVAANSPHDGYTLLVVSTAHAVGPWLYKLPYDSIKAFAPVAILASGPNVLVVYPGFAAHSVKELVALRQGAAGRAAICLGRHRQASSTSAPELFKLTAGVEREWCTPCPTRAAASAMTDVIGGHAQIIFASLLVQATGFIANEADAERWARAA